MTTQPVRILLLGMNGQVGWELQRSLAPLGDLIALGRDGHPGHPGLVGDLSDLTGLACTLAKVQADVVVNAAAHTAVDRAEIEPALCQIINVDAPTVLARWARASGALLVHYSSDYVFDGSGSRAWIETDRTGPLNVYGQSKLQAESAILASGCRHLILRSSWIYGHHGDNFAKTMLHQAQEHKRLSVIDDHSGAPTGADLLADVTAHTIRATLERPTLDGIYHVVAAGQTSWYGYARFVLEQALAMGVAMRAEPSDLIPVPSAEFSTPARRPRNSRLSTHKLQTAFGLRLPPWQNGVQRMLREYLQRV